MACSKYGGACERACAKRAPSGKRAGDEHRSERSERGAQSAGEGVGCGAPCGDIVDEDGNLEDVAGEGLGCGAPCGGGIERGRAIGGPRRRKHWIERTT
jgi:hypothetical protein